MGTSKQSIRLVKEALRVWSNGDFPRRVTTHQIWSNTLDNATRRLLDVEQSESDEPFMSTYSFPRGSTTDGELPKVDTLFVDFDIPESEASTPAQWRRDLSEVLLRSRKVAQGLLESGPECWRASLSGGKGVHLFLDFPAVEPAEGNQDQFREGLNGYAKQVESKLSELAGVDISRFVDVTSADLARLCRAPNTLHGSATEFHGEKRYCVPVSIKELASVGPEEYERLTSSRRELPAPYSDGRSPNQFAGKRVTQAIRTADAASSTTASPSNYSKSPKDRRRVKRYREESNEAIGLDDLDFLLSDRPCILSFQEREDMFDRGHASRVMELSSILAMAEQRVPIPVIKEFFSSHENFSERQTEFTVEDIISRMDEETLFSDTRVDTEDREGMKQFNCQTVIQEAPTFCKGAGCNIYTRSDDLQL